MSESGGFKSLQKPEKKDTKAGRKDTKEGEEQLCMGCKHWQPFISSYAGVGKGKCLRHPPRLNPHANSGAAEDPGCWMFPVVMANHTCGEWAAGTALPPAKERAFDEGAFA